MKQILLAIALIAAPVAGFSGYEFYAHKASATTAGLGDLSSFRNIIADVQGIAATGDLARAAKRITDYESAWDQAQSAIRPLNPTFWDNIDGASDAALKALREQVPSADKVQKTLTDLMRVLVDPSKSAS